MHKNFAKTRFLGKTVTYLPECHSTNDYLAQLTLKQQLSHGDVVVTDFQSKGKGQRGNSWISERGKNLLFSFLLKPHFLGIGDAYLLNIIAGLSVARLVKKFNSALNCTLKWPNDVFIEDRKIAGILIETSLSNQFENAIVGIGLNINQSYFPMPTATSLKLETGITYDLSEVLEEYFLCFEYFYQMLESGEKGKALRLYHEIMYWRGEMHSYKSKGEVFNAVLIGINEHGHLVLNCEGSIHSFRTKEVEFIN